MPTSTSVQKLADLNIRPISLCHKLVARHSDAHIDQVIAAGQKRAKASVGGWVRRALEEGWVVETVENAKVQRQVEQSNRLAAQEIHNRAEAEKMRRLEENANILLRDHPVEAQRIIDAHLVENPTAAKLAERPMMRYLLVRDYLERFADERNQEQAG